MPHDLDYEIGFADSEVLSLHRKSQTLVVRLQLWTARVVDVTFSDVLQVVDRAAWTISAVREATDIGSSALTEAVARHYRGEAEHGFRLFQFLDEDDEPALEVVVEQLPPIVEEVSNPPPTLSG
jgi:hypothetical protein